MENTSRKSNIELLRIVAAIFVIVLHYNDGRAFNYVIDGSTNQYVLFLFESISICAVDLFVLISGYFLSSTNKRKLAKPFELYFEITFIKICMYLLIVFYKLVFKSIFAFNLLDVLKCFVLNNYFVVLYIVLYLVSPYINLLLSKLDKDNFKHLLILAIAIFSIYAIFTDLYQEITNTEPMGLSPITAWGNKQGFNIVNFILLYIIGAYLRTIETNKKLINILSIYY